MGYEKLRAARWGAVDKKRIEKLHKKLAPADWSKKSLLGVRSRVRKQLLKQQKYACAYCRRVLSSEIGGNEIDHIVAKSIHGAFTYARMNLVVACKRCNFNKREHDVLRPGIVVGTSYPVDPSAYIWIHPYVHRYSKHIKCHDGVVFEAVGGAEERLRAQAVIRICRLDKMLTVQRRAMEEAAIHCEDATQAVLTLVGKFHASSVAEIARALRKLEIFRHVAVADLEALVASVRDGAFRSLTTGLVRLGL